eukprot:gene9281-16975_t
MDETKRKQAGIIEDKDETLLTKSDDICRRWKNYCEELFNYNIQKDQEVLKEQVTEERQEEETILMSEKIVYFCIVSASHGGMGTSMT